MVRETCVQSQVASYQRLQKWYLIPPCLTLSNIRYVWRVKLSNTWKGVAPSPTPWWISNWKGGLLVALDYSRQLYLVINRKIKNLSYNGLTWNIFIHGCSIPMLEVVVTNIVYYLFFFGGGSFLGVRGLFFVVVVVLGLFLFVWLFCFFNHFWYH